MNNYIVTFEYRVMVTAFAIIAMFIPVYVETAPFLTALLQILIQLYL